MTSLLSVACSQPPGADKRGALLVTPPALERRLPNAPTSLSSSAAKAGPAACGLLAVHGGAGVSSLRRAGVAGVDFNRVWPLAGFVVVVARSHAFGLEWARDAARQHASGCAPKGVALAGLVVVADAPGRAPSRVAKFLDLVAAAYPRVWEVPWVEEWRLAGHTEPLPSPPAVRQLDKDLQALFGAYTA